MGKEHGGGYRECGVNFFAAYIIQDIYAEGKKMEGMLMKEQKGAAGRIDWVDVAKGVVIVLMIYGHAIEVESKPWLLVFSFHMPFFIMASGFFFKDVDLKRFVQKNGKGLLLPYVVTIIISHVLNVALWGVGWKEACIKAFFTILLGVSKKGNLSYFMTDETGVLWFVPMLFCVKLLFLLVSKWSKGKEFIRFSILSLMVLLGLCLQYKGYWMPWSLDIALYGIGFYYIGYLLKKYDVFSLLFQNVWCNSLWFFVWLVGASNWFRYEIAMRSCTGEMICIITALAGCLLCCTVSYCLSRVNWIKRFLGWIGRGTMVLLCLHHLEWAYVRYENFHLHPGHRLFVVKILLIGSGYFVIWLLKKIGGGEA